MSDFTNWFNCIIANKEANEWAVKSEDRHTRAYQEMLGGYKINPAELLLKVEQTDYPGLIAMKDINYSSVCKHHLLPFFGKIDLVYEPGTGLFGAGKLPRVVDAHARRLQLQENLCRDVAETLIEAGAQGAYIRASATHTCIVCRGPKAYGTIMNTTYSTGSLEDKTRLREIQLSLE